MEIQFLGSTIVTGSTCLVQAEQIKALEKL